MANIIDIEGIGEVHAKKLTDAGIRTVEALLEQGGSESGRRTIANQTGIDEKRILEWVNRADLARIKGIGSEFADLLEAAGVDTVRELAQRRADNLQAKLAEVNEAKNIVRRVPGVETVEDWIMEAKSLPTAVTH